MSKLLNLLLLFFCLTIGSNLFAQSSNGRIIDMQFRKVSAEHEKEFIEKETKYWSVVASQGIKEGQLVGWHLWKRVGFSGDDHNYVFLNVYKDLDQAVHSNFWSKADSVIGVNSSYFGTMDISTVTASKRFVLINGLGEGNSKYIVRNFSKTENANAFIDENINLWKPHFEKNMSKMGMTAWGIARQVYPQGADETTVYTYDFYDTLVNVYKALSGTHLSLYQNVVDKSNMKEIDPDGFSQRIIYERVMSVNSED